MGNDVVMQLVIVLVAVVVIGLATLVAAGRFGEQPAEPVRDIYQPPFAEHRRLRASDIEGIRFGVTPMGYDMAEVDLWMARIARELNGRDEPGPVADAVADGPRRADIPARDAALPNSVMDHAE